MDGSVRARRRVELDPARVEAVRRAARTLVERTRERVGGGPTLPIDVRALAETLHIPVEVSRHVDRWDALLVPTRGGGFRILASERSRSRGRVRFSIAHELAHTFLERDDDDVQHRGGRRVDDDQVERLCDVGASELLMPGSDVEAFLAHRAPSPATLLELARGFDVSREAAALRLCDVAAEPIAVAFFDYGVRPGVRAEPERAQRPPDLVSAYRVKRAFHGQGFEPYLPFGKSVPATSVVEKASLEPGTHAAIEELTLGRRTWSCAVQAERLPGGRPGEPPAVCAVLRRA